jgi:hypothetical protein
MAIVSEISWDDMLDSKPLPETSARIAGREAVAEIAEKARTKLLECSGRVNSAVKIALAGDVELLADGTAQVASQSNGGTVYHGVNGHCDLTRCGLCQRQGTSRTGVRVAQRPGSTTATSAGYDATRTRREPELSRPQSRAQAV